MYASRMHDLTEMLVVALAAILSGADSWVGIALWGQGQLEWLRRYLPLRNGIASHDTFGRVFAALDARQFEACFVRWVSGICPAVAGQVVAIDGKTVRRSHGMGRSAIHLVSAYCGTLGATLGQVRTADKSNEITAIPALLDALLLKGAIVTIDAMGCQREIAAKIVAGGADYVLAVKGNQPALHEAIVQLFDAQRAQSLRSVRFAEHCQTGKKVHGRIETRRCVATDMIDWLDEDGKWAGLRSVAMVEATREIDGRVSLERRYYVNSLPADPKRINEAVRAHWAIENSMHWVLDVAFGEDQCRARVDNAAQNFAILRRIVSNLLRADKATKVGIKNKRLKAGFDEHYRAQVLGMQVS
ncbi:ISAs1 family transposase ISAzo3 [Paraburkholderia saeva]|nr:ISAs1 family transposase ISAzo3 [Paraburkholderia saeva]